MRYTTIIDVSEIPRVYTNTNAVRVYLHLCLKCGYHDGDRDIIVVSIRRLSYELGLTLSAIRHALTLLSNYGLIKYNGGSTWTVTKWVTKKSIGTRAKTEAEQQIRDRRELETQELEERHRQKAAEDRKREAMRKQGKTSFTEYYEQHVLPLAERGDPEGLRLKALHEEAYNNTIAELKKELEEALK